MPRTTSIRTRLLASLLIIALASAGLLSWYFLNELEAYGLRKLEERLGSEASLLATFASQVGIDQTETLQQVTETAEVPTNTWLRVVDSDGIVVADSIDTVVGEDFGQRPEILTALRGGYGADTRITDNGKVALLIAYPVYGGESEIVGAATSSATTFSIMSLLRDYQMRLLGVIALFVIVTFVLAELLARWLSRPLRQLEVGATALAQGNYDSRVHPTGSREIRAVGIAFNTMADEVQRYVGDLRAEERRKSQFVSDVSHELRTPLTAIRGTAETLLEGDVEREDADRFLTTIVRESERLAGLADDLLTLQRIDGATGELPISRIDLRIVAENAVAALEHLLEQRNIKAEIRGSAPAVLGDADRLQQVIANLIDNASRVMRDGTIRIDLAHDGDYALLTVIDEGPGIPVDDLPHVFDRFYRAQRSRDRTSGGAGLGLAIVKAIIDRHVGTIEAANRPEGGACISIRLPALRD